MARQRWLLIQHRVNWWGWAPGTERTIGRRVWGGGWSEVGAEKHGSGFVLRTPPPRLFPGSSQSLFQWAKAVQIRTNLDLVLDWLQGEGLGDIATEFFRKLSTTANLLCVPKSSLLQVNK